MTAFARAQLQTEFAELSMEIRTVNQRFQEISMRLPESLRYLEPDFRTIISKNLRRGKVELVLIFNREAEQTSLQINQKNVSRLTNALAVLQEQMPNLQAFSASELLKWPGVVQPVQFSEDELRHHACDLLRTTLKKLVEMRKKEGETLKNLLFSHVDNAFVQLKDIINVSNDIEHRINTRIKEKCARLQLELEPSRLEQELVFLLQKTDITEEIDRIKMHLEEVKAILIKGGIVGRRLDFLMQELNREANTLGAKSVMLETTNVALELKVIIEQMREQIQNIE